VNPTPLAGNLVTRTTSPASSQKKMQHNYVLLNYSKAIYECFSESRVTCLRNSVMQRMNSAPGRSLISRCIPTDPTHSLPLLVRLQHSRSAVTDPIWEVTTWLELKIICETDWYSHQIIIDVLKLRPGVRGRTSSHSALKTLDLLHA
jgi:hypothetical protein